MFYFVMRILLPFFFFFVLQRAAHHTAHFRMSAFLTHLFSTSCPLVPSDLFSKSPPMIPIKQTEQPSRDCCFERQSLRLERRQHRYGVRPVRRNDLRVRAQHEHGRSELAGCRDCLLILRNEISKTKKSRIGPVGAGTEKKILSSSFFHSRTDYGSDLMPCFYHPVLACLPEFTTLALFRLQLCRKRYIFPTFYISMRRFSKCSFPFSFRAHIQTTKKKNGHFPLCRHIANDVARG